MQLLPNCMLAMHHSIQVEFLWDYKLSSYHLTFIDSKSHDYASVGGARWRHTVVRLCFCLSVSVCVCVTLQLAFLKARDKLSADTCNAGTTRQYLKANSLRFLI